MTAPAKAKCAKPRPRKPAAPRRPVPDAAAPSILCQAWREDEVWNAAAFDLPVVVSGRSLERAMHNLEDAIAQHVASAMELGILEEAVLGPLHEARQQRNG